MEEKSKVCARCKKPYPDCFHTHLSDQFFGNEYNMFIRITDMDGNGVSLCHACWSEALSQINAYMEEKARAQKTAK